MDKPSLQQEQREVLQTAVVADFIRHEKPIYTEAELISGNLEGTLDAAAREKAKEHAEGLAGQIDKEQELVVFWVSPKQRAKETYQIYKNVFLGAGVEIYESGINRPFKESLRDTAIGEPGSEYFYQAVQSGKLKGYDEWMKLWTEANDLPGDVESAEAVEKRSKRVLTYLHRIAATIAPTTHKKLHFVCIGHEEGVRDLLEASLGQGTEKGTGPTYGEAVRIEMVPAKKDETGRVTAPGQVSVAFRGQAAKIGFDPTTREFIESPEV